MKGRCRGCKGFVLKRELTPVYVNGNKLILCVDCSKNNSAEVELAETAYNDRIKQKIRGVK